MVRSFCTTKAALFGVSADGSGLFLGNDVSGNANLKAPDSTSTLGFSNSKVFAAVVASCLGQSWKVLSIETSKGGKNGF